MTAEIYTHDKQLFKAWSLSEGRQRVNTGFYDSNGPASNGMPLQGETTQSKEEISTEMEGVVFQGKQEREEMMLQIERKDEEIRLLRLQIERERKKKRLQKEQDQDREDIVQEQNKPVLKKSKKERDKSARFRRSRLLHVSQYHTCRVLFPLFHCFFSIFLNTKYQSRP